jgi:hypothetical protein
LQRAEPTSLLTAFDSPCHACVNNPCREKTIVEYNGLTVVECLRQVTEDMNWIQQMGGEEPPELAKVEKWLRREVGSYRDQAEFYRGIIREQRKHIRELERRVEAVTIANAIIRVKP